MFEGIHRVISEADEMGNESTQGQQLTIASAPAAPGDVSGAAGQSPSFGANVVEPDTGNSMDVDAPVALVAPPAHSETLSTSSSLSDTSSAAAAIAEMQNEHQELIVMDETDGSGKAQPLRRTGRLQRMDSANESTASGSQRESSQTSSRDWGWFTEDGTDHNLASPDRRASKSKRRGLVPQHSGGSVGEIVVRPKDSDTSAMAVTAPTYVLEESLSTQRLWKDTAGQRPPQPVEERAFYEKMWQQNFARSQVNYSLPVEVLTATSPISLSPFADGNFEGPTEGNELSNYNLASASAKNGASKDVAEAAIFDRMKKPTTTETVNQQKGDLKVLVRGDNVFGTTVSKSFTQSSERGGGVDTFTISIASYRVVETKKGGKFAQYLVVYREGSVRDTVGVWKRYSDFEELARKVTQQHEGCAAVIANMSPLAMTEEPDTEHLPNAITSWRLLKKRQRWYRCLDAGYLSLKVFLLERFLHDILFESSSPQLLRDFVHGNDMEEPSRCP